MPKKEIETYPVLLAGGVGSRLWPVSRELFPKQLVNLTGDDSLIQDTIKRHEYNFLVLGEKTISTAELEVLKQELYHLEKKFKQQPVEVAEPFQPESSPSDTNSFKFFDDLFDEN